MDFIRVFYRPQIGIVQFTNSAYCVLDEFIVIHTCHTYITCTPFLGHLYETSNEGFVSKRQLPYIWTS